MLSFTMAEHNAAAIGDSGRTQTYNLHFIRLGQSIQYLNILNSADPINFPLDP